VTRRKTVASNRRIFGADSKAATSTTLGIGDLHRSRVMRLIAGMESLNGLVLIGGSASFISHDGALGSGRE
jgi:hypothetical protein